MTNIFGDDSEGFNFPQIDVDRVRGIPMSRVDQRYIEQIRGNFPSRSMQDEPSDNRVIHDQRRHIDQLRNEIGRLNSILQGRLYNDGNTINAREGEDILEHLRRHSDSRYHRGNYKDSEPRALSWIIRNMSQMQNEIRNMYDRIQSKSKPEKDNTDNILAELKKIVEE